MRLKLVQTKADVFTPNGGGQKASYLRETQFDMVMEGAFIRFRVKDKKDGQVYSIPVANVAVVEFTDSAHTGFDPKDGKK